MLTRRKVQGMVVGGAIGDAAGKPVETWTPEKIFEVHPEGVCVGKYLPPIGHKWFKEEDHPPGTTTDDTQLGLAVMRGFIDGHQQAALMSSFEEYHHDIAAKHVEAFEETTDGWGNTTREAIRNICNGSRWITAGLKLNFGGTGNGVPMKVSPFAAWYASPQARIFDPNDLYFNQQVVRHSAMTHFTDISAQAALVHTHAVYHCLSSGVDHYTNESLLDLIADQVWEWGEEKSRESGMYYEMNSLRKHPTEEGDSLEDRMIWLFQNRSRINKIEQDEIRERFGKGTCYVLDSLPFSYAYFLKCPFTPQSIFDVIEAGGDTDTNAKLVGEMVGALNGIEVFLTEDWKWTCDGLGQFQELMDAANLFCDTFGIGDGKDDE